MTAPTFRLERVERARGQAPRWLFTADARPGWTTTVRAFPLERSCGVYVWIESNGPGGQKITGTGDRDIDFRLQAAIRGWMRKHAGPHGAMAA